VRLGLFGSEAIEFVLHPIALNLGLLLDAFEIRFGLLLGRVVGEGRA
jgi:hypothetical protein